MSNLRRYDSGGRPYFLTSVTYNRQPFLLNNERLLMRTLERAKTVIPHEMTAWVILPDHFHVIVIFPDDSDGSQPAGEVDLPGSDPSRSQPAGGLIRPGGLTYENGFNPQLRRSTAPEAGISRLRRVDKSGSISRLMHWIKQSFSMNYRKSAGAGIGRVWQYRFWDHIIRDENDWRRHVDYIHYNPVKHGLTRSPFDYSFSSIHEYRDCYQPDWGNESPIDTKHDFGE